MTLEAERADIELNTCAVLTAVWNGNEEVLDEMVLALDFAELAGVTIRTARALLSFLEHEHRIGVGPAVPERIRASALRATNRQIGETES